MVSGPFFYFMLLGLHLFADIDILPMAENTLCIPSIAKIANNMLACSGILCKFEVFTNQKAEKGF